MLIRWWISLRHQVRYHRKVFTVTPVASQLFLWRRNGRSSTVSPGDLGSLTGSVLLDEFQYMRGWGIGAEIDPHRRAMVPEDRASCSSRLQAPGREMHMLGTGEEEAGMQVQVSTLVEVVVITVAAPPPEAKRRCWR